MLLGHWGQTCCALTHQTEIFWHGCDARPELFFCGNFFLWLALKHSMVLLWVATFPRLPRPDVKNQRWWLARGTFPARTRVVS